jgi:hypothetical protein
LHTKSNCFLSTNLFFDIFFAYVHKAAICQSSVAY